MIEAAHDRESLIAALGAIDIAVPGRADGRENKHRERWTTCRLVATLAVNEQLPFPLSLRRKSPPHPDYLLELNGCAIGVEVTEATYPDYNRYLDLFARKFPDAILDIGLFARAQYDTSGNRIPVPETVYRSQLERNELVSEGWSCLEGDWVRAIKSSITNKHKKLINVYQHECAKNWLAIKSNLPIELIDLEKAMNALCNEIKPLWDSLPHFERIFIERGNVIASISSIGWQQFTIKHLWHSPDPLSSASEEAEKIDWREFDEQLWISLTAKGAKQ